MTLPATDALVTDTSSEKQTQRARRQVRDRAAEERAVLRKVLGTYEGRAFVWTLLERAGLYEDMRGSDADVREQIGRRRFGLRLMAESSEHRELFTQMQTEAVARAERDRKAAAANRIADQADEAEER